jgi:small subunit ribosomal protein S21
LNRNYRQNHKHNRNHSYDPSRKGIYVEVRNGDVTGAIRKFKKKVQESGILQEVKDRQEYVKPSEKRKRNKAAAKRRQQRELKKRQLEQGY